MLNGSKNQELIGIYTLINEIVHRNEEVSVVECNHLPLEIEWTISRWQFMRIRYKLLWFLVDHPVLVVLSSRDRTQLYGKSIYSWQSPHCSSVSLDSCWLSPSQSPAPPVDSACLHYHACHPNPNTMTMYASHQLVSRQVRDIHTYSQIMSTKDYFGTREVHFAVYLSK